jgi:hypothetical protein
LETNPDIAVSARLYRPRKAPAKAEQWLSSLPAIEQHWHQICRDSGISPICQRLYYTDSSRELDSQETIETIGMLSGETMRCEVIEEEDEDGIEMSEGKGTQRHPEGFGGTALTGRIGE